MAAIGPAGENLVTSYPGGGWALASGTSFAAGWISGAAALFDLDVATVGRIEAAFPTFTVPDVSADDVIELDGVGETYELRTSGLLSRSNKVMYEFHTRSVFDTFTGEAVTGSLRAAVLVMLNMPLALIGGIAAIYLTEGSGPISNTLGLVGIGTGLRPLGWVAAVDGISLFMVLVTAILFPLAVARMMTGDTDAALGCCDRGRHAAIVVVPGRRI